MKEIVISSKRLKTEILTWGVCFIIANLCNLYAIITYGESSFKELITSLGYVFILSLAIYFAWSVIRILFFAVKRLFSFRKSNG